MFYRHLNITLCLFLILREGCGPQSVISAFLTFSGWDRTQQSKQGQAEHEAGDHGSRGAENTPEPPRELLPASTATVGTAGPPLAWWQAWYGTGQSKGVRGVFTSCRQERLPGPYTSHPAPGTGAGPDAQTQPVGAQGHKRGAVAAGCAPAKRQAATVAFLPSSGKQRDRPGGC